MVAIGMSLTGLIAYANSYPNKVLPGLSLGAVPIGGMTREELKSYLQQMNDKLVQDGLHFSIETPSGKNTTFVMYPLVVTETNSVELMMIDVDAEVDRLVGYGKEGHVFTRANAIIRSRLQEPRFMLAYVTAQEVRIEETLKDHLAQYEQKPQQANIVVSPTPPYDYEFTTSSPGVVYEFDGVIDQLVQAWAALRVPEVLLKPKVEHPRITLEAAQSAATGLEDVLQGGNLLLLYTTPTGRDIEWRLTPEQFGQWLEVREEPLEDDVEGWRTVLGINQESLLEYLDTYIGPVVEVDAQDAKFSVAENGQVTEFQGSRPGVALKASQIQADIETALLARIGDESASTSVMITTELSEPIVKTGDVNTLGIAEVLGEGVSSFAGSPSNRQKNIRNAVRKLNGVIVKPGEEFSTIEHTQPYTLEGGYLPELVIKGDEIKPEIGGGLCQIGTTLFRMAMNSGLEITERRNHSLVVNYYNDLKNGLPGTDATIYDPAPDFKFKNDTNHHVLIQATADWDKQELHFVLWGTNDGRSGEYEPPVVHRWIPHAETKIIETTKLKPGERQCQHAYTGADASFTYTRTFADGTVEDQIFESHYRPLPEICLVGVEKEEEAFTCSGDDCFANLEAEEQLREDVMEDQLIILE